MLPEGLSIAVLRGFPQPATAGHRYDALARSARANGQTRPIVVDGDGVVWDGRTLLNVLLDHGIEPEFKLIADGFMAAIGSRVGPEFTVLETAELVAWLSDGADGRIDWPTKGKRARHVSEWLRDHMGWERGFSTRQVEHYLQVARADSVLKREIDKNDTLNGARRKLGLVEGRTRSEFAGKGASEVRPRTVETLAECLEALSEKVDELSEEEIQTLQVMTVVLGQLLHRLTERNVCANEGDQQ